MLNKAQLSIGKLIALLGVLTVIWILCVRAEHQFPIRFQEDMANRMGARLFNSTKLSLALDIKANKSQQSVLRATKAMDQSLTVTYRLSQQTEEQLICIVVRDFNKNDNYDEDYKTARSILKQQYKNYHILYVSEQQDPSLDKLKSYFTVNQLSDSRYTFVSAYVDTVDVLFRVSEKCPQNAIMLLMENGERFSTSLALKVINANFANGIELTWASSLYANDKLGFSFDYSQKIRADQNFRKYPLAMNDVIAFRNYLFYNSRAMFIDQHIYYPLYMAESFGFTFLKRTQDFKYIPEVLTFKERVYRLRTERPDLEKQLEQLIREDNSIMGLLKSVANANN